MARGEWSTDEDKVILAHIDKYPSQIRDTGLLPGRTIHQIAGRHRRILCSAGLLPKRLRFKDATTGDVNTIRDLIMRQGVTIDECAEKYDTTPRKICQLMGWE